ncbi:MAG: alpha/beta hydrolase [Anaerolineaceae bacterium]|nr:alpha/beta hydrolase [Anaerolineaceae bacterium]
MYPNWEPNSIIANGASFNYYRTSGTKDSGKPILVLQHGFSDNGLCWGPVAQELAEDYDVILPDARGHGLSARVARGESIDQAADLAALMHALGVKKALVAGHSMGAQIAAALGARFPERVTGLVLEDPPWFLPPPAAQQAPRGSMEESPMGQWMIGLKDKSLEQIMLECREEHPTWPDGYVRAWCQGKKELDLNFLAAGSRWDGWQEHVPGIQCPTLLITADPGLGGIVTPEVERMVKEMNPKIRFVNFPGVGHHIRFAVHQAYMQAFTAFVREAA